MSQTQNNITVVSTREKTIDILRAFAVLLMIITHVIAIAFDHGNGNKIIYYLGIFGGIASFSTFLLLSGAANYISFIHLKNSARKSVNLKKIKIFSRSIQILLAYYFLAALSLFVSKSAFVSNDSADIVGDIFRIVFFLRVPEFTEFLLTFVAFNITLLIFRRSFKFIASDIRVVTVTSLIFYSIGHLLYPLNFADDKLNLLKALIAGHEGLHTFPLLQYLPVLLIGLYLGRILMPESAEEEKDKNTKISFLTLSLILTTLVCFIAYSETKFEIFNLSFFEARFPPSIGFLALSLAIAMVLFSFIKFALGNALSKFEYLYRLISKNALSFFIIHTFLLLIFEHSSNEKFPEGDWKYSTIKDIFILYFVVVFISIFIVLLRENLIKLYFVFDKYTNTHKFIVNVATPVLALSIIVTTLGFTVFDNYQIRTQTRVFSSQGINRTFGVEENSENWFDDNFEYYQRIKTEDLSEDEVFISKNWVKLNFNHKVIVDSNKLKNKNGEDIRVVKFIEGIFVEVPILIKNPNSENAEITFKFEQEGNSNYYLYYGNNFSGLSATPIDTSGIESATSLNLEGKVEHTLMANINQQWFLKDLSETPNLNFTVTPNLGNIQYIAYKIENTDLQGTLISSNGKDYTAQVDTSSLNPGNYSIQATLIQLTDELKVYKSFKVPFYVSYPIYVSWSLDWEGWGVAQYELNDIVDISSKYKMPLTHFFNPRIYIEEQTSTHTVDQNAANYFTNWVLDRKNKGDEIGLHLHFYPDLLREIGIEPRTDAALIGISRDETYIQAYSEEELEQIFEWSLDKFREKGLGTPISFRSGAWMSSPEVLEVLSQSGFLIDSSGRTGGLLNPAWNGSTKIPWNLSPTTNPYMPSVADMNSWEGERIDIWEFPNNGADSYWFSAEDLKTRFDMNYPIKGEFLDRPKVVTYLSHPHGFTLYDTSKIRALLDYTSKFLYTNEDGPVVYSTLENIYYNWDKEAFINGE